MIPLLVACSAARADEPAPTPRYDTVEQVLAEFANEPTIAEVQAWTDACARTSPDAVRRWLAQSRTFAALPSVDLDYDFGTGWDTGYAYYVLSGLPQPSSPSDELFDAPDDAGISQDQDFGISLGWELGDLVMSSERIRVIAEVQDAMKLRDTMLAEVTRLYFERRRLQVEMLLAPKVELADRVQDRIRLLELTARVDAFTGGRFSESTRARGVPPPILR